jgi:hypothetical protein
MVDHIAEIARIRARNNGVWICILELALKHAPTQTKQLLADIHLNDRKISDHVAEIIDDEN